MKIRVLQGESDVAEENDLLGEFMLSGIRAGAARASRRSRSPSTSTPTASCRSRRATSRPAREQSITVNATGTLSDEEIQKIIDDNELYEIQFKE